MQIPTSAAITIGDPHVLRSEEVLDANGLRYLTGIEADYQLTVYNQYGEVMGPGSGISVQESVEQTGGERATGVTQPAAVMPDKNGVFHDGFGPVWMTYGSISKGNAEGIVMGMLKDPTAPLTVKQTLTISVGGVPFATATSGRSYTNVDSKGNLLPYALPGGGITNNYRFTTTPVEITPLLRGHMIF